MADIEDKSQAINAHPCRKRLSSLQCSDTLMDVMDLQRRRSAKNKKTRSSRLSSISSPFQIKKALGKLARSRTFSNKSGGHSTDETSALSTEERAERQRREEEKMQYLRHKMEVFLGSLEGDSPQRRDRKTVRSSSFWGMGQSDSDAVGELIDLKTFYDQKGCDLSSDTEGTTARNRRHGANRSLCLKKCVLNPANGMRKTWDILFVFLSLIYTAIRVPYAIAFDLEEFNQIDTWFILNRLVDTVFIADMVIICCTAKRAGRKMITNHRKIFMMYLKTWFVFDFIASIPFSVPFQCILDDTICYPLSFWYFLSILIVFRLDFLIWAFSGAKIGDKSGNQNLRASKLLRVIKIFRTLRILRLLKIRRIVLSLKLFFGLSYNLVRMMKFLVSIAMVAHLIACGFLFISDREIDPGLSMSSEYVAGVYWAATTMTTIGFGDIGAITMSERVYSVFSMLIGAVVFTYSVTRIVHVFLTMNKSQRNLTESLENVSEWAKYHEFPDEMVANIKKYLHYKASRSYYDEKSVMSGLSLALRRKVLNQMYGPAMVNVDLFKQCSDEFVTEIMLKMHSEFASPYSLVIQQGSIGDSMYLIQKGYCAVYRGLTRRDVQSTVILGPGQAFGEVALLADNVTRTANVVALEWCDLAVITREAFAELIDFFPRDKFKMHKYAESKIGHWKLIRQREHQQRKAREARRSRRKSIEKLQRESRRSSDSVRSSSSPNSSPKSPASRRTFLQSVSSRRKSMSMGSPEFSSNGPDTKSVSVDIRRFRQSVRAVSLSDYLDISADIDMQVQTGNQLQPPLLRKWKSMPTTNAQTERIQNSFGKQDPIRLKIQKLQAMLKSLDKAWVTHNQKNESQQMDLKNSSGSDGNRKGREGRDGREISNSFKERLQALRAEVYGKGDDHDREEQESLPLSEMGNESERTAHSLPTHSDQKNEKEEASSSEFEQDAEAAKIRSRVSSYHGDEVEEREIQMRLQVPEDGNARSMNADHVTEDEPMAETFDLDSRDPPVSCDLEEVSADIRKHEVVI